MRKAMAQRISESTRGVYIISPTPFTEDGRLDLASTDTLVDFYFDKGVTGITILGVLGEATKLTPDESRTFLDHVMKRVDGRKPVVVGASNPGTDNLVRFANEAMERGAAGLMIAPLPGLKTDDQVYAYWETVLSRLGPDIPVCYQDYPQTTTVVTSVAVINRLVDDFPNFVMLKHEESPGLTKITKLRERSDAGKGRRISILVGNGGLYLPQELRRGVDGAMTGFAYPEMLVGVCERFFAGDAEGAEDLFGR
jgi:4-hydroxy-tetrahydrodipicolinate synthase